MERLDQCPHCNKIHRNFKQKDDLMTCGLCNNQTLMKYFILNRNMLKEMAKELI